MQSTSAAQSTPPLESEAAIDWQAFAEAMEESRLQSEAVPSYEQTAEPPADNEASVDGGSDIN
jgi:hypothetical protein